VLVRTRQPLRAALVAVVAIAGLAACTSTPSARRVALDVIETLDADESVKECMRGKVEAYSQDELQAIADGAAESPPDAAQVEALEQFEADLAECRSSR
jgi:hypothetical protein